MKYLNTLLEFGRVAEFSSSEIFYWFVFYFVLSLLNLLLLAMKEVRLRWVLAWAIGLELISLGSVYASYYEHAMATSMGWAIFSWTFQIFYCILYVGGLYNLICLSFPLWKRNQPTPVEA